MAFGSQGTMRCAVVWKMFGTDEQINVWHFSFLDAPGDDELLYDDLEQWLVYLYADVVGYMVDDLDHDRVEVYNVGDNSPEPWLGAISGLNGTNASDMLPPGNAPLIYARTSVARVIGKKYLPGFHKGTVENGLFASSVVADLTDMVNKMKVAFVATNGTAFRYGVYREAVNQFLLPFDIRATNVPAYQRRRRQGRGA